MYSGTSDTSIILKIYLARLKPSSIYFTILIFKILINNVYKLF